MPEYRFIGGDGDPHVVTNHNRFLDLYDGAIGMKTGATRRSGSSLVAAATRDGHTLIAVVIGSPSTYQQAAELLDRAFLAKASRARADLHAGGRDRRRRPTTATTATSTTVAASSTTGSASADTDAGRAAGEPEPASASTGASDSTTLLGGAGLRRRGRPAGRRPRVPAAGQPVDRPASVASAR